MVSFWDTSAVIPLTVEEPATAQVRPILEGDPGMVVWWATSTECHSALCRRLRENANSRSVIRDARRSLVAMAGEWSEVAATEAVRRRAERLLGVHAIRAADALQLAAALVWTRDEPRGHGFVCLDERLGEAAHKEGFAVLPAP
ncbi:MAG: type II toxin-antitoxin system VapC family toxin [Planctomycetota bacterium]